MKKLSVRKNVWLSVAVLSLTLGVLGIVGTALFALRLRYFPMAVCIALTAHGFYGTPFYFINFCNLRIIGKIILCMESGCVGAEEISEKLQLKPDFIKKLISKAEKGGYISIDKTEEKAEEQK